MKNDRVVKKKLTNQLIPSKTDTASADDVDNDQNRMKQIELIKQPETQEIHTDEIQPLHLVVKNSNNLGQNSKKNDDEIFRDNNDESKMENINKQKQLKVMLCNKRTETDINDLYDSDSNVSKNDGVIIEPGLSGLVCTEGRASNIKPLKVIDNIDNKDDENLDHSVDGMYGKDTGTPIVIQETDGDSNELIETNFNSRDNNNGNGG